MKRPSPSAPDVQKTISVTRHVVTQLPTRYGMFDMYGYTSQPDGVEHVALVKGSLAELVTSSDTTSEPLPEPPHVRIHSECLTGDIFASLRCDCGEQLQKALQHLASESVSTGAVVYLRAHEGRGIGLMNKLAAYNLQAQGMNTIEANTALGFPHDLRDYGVGARILEDLGIKRCRLITNNPDKVESLEKYGITVAGVIALPSNRQTHNAKYLDTKIQDLGHTIETVE